MKTLHYINLIAFIVTIGLYASIEYVMYGMIASFFLGIIQLFLGIILIVYYKNLIANCKNEIQQDEQEENLLLRAYARIAPPDTGLNDGGGDSYGGQNCDNGGSALSIVGPRDNKLKIAAMIHIEMLLKGSED